MLLLLGGDRSLGHTDTNLYVMGRTPCYCSLPTWLSLTWQTGLITIYGCEKPSFPLGFLRCYPVGSDRRPLLLESVHFISFPQSCPALCDPVNCSMPGLLVHHQLSEFTQTHVHWVGDAIQAFHPLSSPSPPTFNLSQHQGLFQWVSSSHQMAKLLEFQC